MQEISTPELLVKHLYNETNALEKSIVNQAIENQVLIKEEYTNMQTAKNALDEIDGNEPNQAVIDTILTYSKMNEIELV